MTDRPRYQSSEMEGQEATEYAFEELGQQLGEATGLDVPNEVRGFLTDELRDRSDDVTGYRYENGYVIEATLKDTIINPKKFIGQKPRFWMSTSGLLNIYFKKQGEYYLLRLRMPMFGEV